MTVEIKGTKVLEWLLESKKRNKVLQGAARSSKTHSIIQYIILKCINQWAGKKKTITIARKALSVLRSSAMRDFFDILDSMKLYSQENHNKTENTYNLHGNLIEFVGADGQKWRGHQRNLLWLNEANEFDFEEYTQGAMRTNEEVILDYNPSDEYHWIYEKIIPRDDTDFKKFSIFDNPLAPEGMKNEILRLKDQDENLWKIYGLGEVGQAKDLIFTNWDIVKEFPHLCRQYRYGLDFGYNNPTGIVFIGVNGNDVYLQEILYRTKLTNQNLIDLMKELDIAKNVLIRADSAEPARIVEIQDAGYKVEGVSKPKDSVKRRIDNLQRRKIHILNTSVNLIKEIKSYRWKRDKKTDEIIDEPVKFNDHLIDATLYATGDAFFDKKLFRATWDNDRQSLPRRSIDNFSLGRF